MIGKKQIKTSKFKGKKKKNELKLISLKKGDYLVHEKHGIGEFEALTTRTLQIAGNKSTKEYIVLKYAPNKRGYPPDRLYVPTSQLNLLSKYIGAAAPKINKLNSIDWEKTKTKAKNNVKKVAAELIKLYAIRRTTKGFSFSSDTPWQREVED